MLDNFRLVEDRSSGVDVAFIFGGVSNRKKSPDLVSLARIYFAPIWFFYRGTETLDRLSQLKGKRIAVGPASRVVMDPLLAANGVNHASATIVSLVGSDAAKALQEGSIDVAPLPFELNSPIVQALLRDPEIRLMSLKEAVTRVFPHFARLVLPQGVIDLERNIPPSDVSLIALTNTVVIRNDLHPELIHLLAEALSEEHGGPGIFQRAGDFPTLTDPEFPIAQSALDFYRSGPSFLNKFLPFWITSYAKRAIAVLVAGFAIVLPLFSYAMTLYRWFVERRLRSIYQHLRDVEAALKKDVTMSDVAAMESDLEVIGRRISNFKVPMRLSDLFYSVKSHFDVVHLRLEMRRNELQGRAPTSVPS